MRNLIMYGFFCVLTSCTTNSTQQQTQLQDESSSSADQEQVAVTPTASPVVPYFVREPITQEPQPQPHNSIRKGTGVFLSDTAASSEPAPALAETIAEAGDITLNFEAADLREFVRVVFEDILKQNYLIDPQVTGKITLHTTYPITEEALLPIVETVLQQNGAAVVFQQGIFKVVTLADAPTLADSSVAGQQSAAQGAGYTVQIVPLRYVSASEIEKIITPLVPKGSSVRIIEARNLLILSGPRYRVKQMLDTVRIFDVDWLKGMSFGLFRLQYAEAAMLIKELENLFGTGAHTPMAGIVRLMPIEQLNAILVIPLKGLPPNGSTCFYDG